MVFRRLFVSGVSTAVVAAGLTLTPAAPSLAVAGSAPAAGAAKAAKPAAKLLDQAAASAQARRTGRAVEVTALTDEYSQTFALPQGTFRLDQATAPERVKGDDGAWHAPDPTLVRHADGTVGPRYAAVGLSFTGGAAGQPLVSVSKGTSRLALRWTGRAVKPTLAGAVATYPEVIPGVDLRLTATSEGYTEVLVVKTAAAAQSPALASLRFSVSAPGMRVLPGVGGGVSVVDARGQQVFAGPAGQMWDSAGNAAAAAIQSKARLAESTATPGAALAGATSTLSSDGSRPQSPATAPAQGNAVAVLPVQTDGQAITIAPSAAVLRGTRTVYPVYIDPPVGLDVSARTMLSSNGSKSWAFSDSDGVGVGHCSSWNGYYCGNGFTNRIFYQFDPTKLAGKNVLDATFRAYETWSFTCTPSISVIDRVDGQISSATNWPGPAIVDRLGDRTVSAGRGSECSPAQGPAWIEFNDNPAETDENLTSTVQKFAAGSWSKLTILLRADDESDTSQWKRFRNDATLQVTYSVKPGVPTAVGPRPTSAPTQVCATTQAAAITVGGTSVTVGAQVNALVAPTNTDEKGSMTAEFGVDKLVGTTWSSAWTGVAPTTGYVPAGTVETSVASGLVNLTTYRVRARTVSHWTLVGVANSQASAYSGYCYFTVNTAAPNTPVVTANAAGGPNAAQYVECVGTTCPVNGGPGVPGSFTFKPGGTPPDPTIAKYIWRFDGSSTSTTTTGSTVTVNTAPPGSNHQRLIVVAVDSLNRQSVPYEYEMNVGTPAPPVGVWSADTTSASTVTADSTTNGTPHALTLSAATSSPLGRRTGAVATDGSLSFNGTTAYATAVKPIDTSTSFTVSAWAYLTDITHNSTVIAQTNNDTTSVGYDLYYSTAYKQWIFNWHYKDSTGATAYTRAVAATINPAVKAWTHLTGVYDSTDHSLQLFVNGRPQGKVAITTAAGYPTATTGPMTLGRTNVSANSYLDYMSGLVDEVKVWQRALPPTEISTEAALLDANFQPIHALVADWQPNNPGASTTAVQDQSLYARPPMTLSTGATLDVNNGSVDLDGVAGSATVAGPMVDELGSFTVQAQVYVDPTALTAKPLGWKGRVIGQRDTTTGSGYSWALWYERSGNGDMWVFSRMVGATPVSATWYADSGAGWVSLAGHYDAQNNTVMIDVNGNETTVGYSGVMQGAGELSAGRGSTSSTAWGYFLPGDLGEIQLSVGA